MTDIQKAMLGDKDAAERLTEKGDLLPCPFCGENPVTRVRVKAQCFEMSVVCFKCGTSRTVQVDICDTEFDKLQTGMMIAKKSWNTRAPILTPEQMKRLEEMEHDTSTD